MASFWSEKMPNIFFVLYVTHTFRIYQQFALDKMIERNYNCSHTSMEIISQFRRELRASIERTLWKSS